MNNKYKQAAEIIKNADALLVGAGAGIGVDSGLPDFRGTKGFWKEYPIIKNLGIKFEEMANPRWFTEKPELAWAFYGHRFNLYKETIPHKGFEHLLNIGKTMKHSYFVYTSNVDGHFQKAGFNEKKINEIHGSINHMQCTTPCQDDIWEASFDNIKINNEKFEAIGTLPHCPHCNALARPNILMFGDWSWNGNRSTEQSLKFQNWILKLKTEKAKLVIIELGAGTAIPSIRLKSQSLVRELDARLIRINPRDYNVPTGQISISTGALEGIENIVNHIDI